MALAREELRAKLRAAVRHATKDGIRVDAPPAGPRARAAERGPSAGARPPAAGQLRGARRAAPGGAATGTPRAGAVGGRARGGAEEHPRGAAPVGRAARDLERGTEGLERGDHLDERGAAVDKRGAGDLQGGAAVAQRGAQHRQHPAPEQGRGAGGPDQRPQQPAQQHRHRDAVPRRAAPHPLVHAAGAQALPGHPDRRRPADHGLRQRFTDDSFLEDAAEVLRNLQTREAEVAAPGTPGICGACCPTAPTTTGSTAWSRPSPTSPSASGGRTRWPPPRSTPSASSTRRASRWSCSTRSSSCGRPTAPSTKLRSPADQARRVLFEINDGDWDTRAAPGAARGGAAGALRIDLEVEHDFRQLGRRHLLVSARRLEDDSSCWRSRTSPSASWPRPARDPGLGAAPPGQEPADQGPGDHPAVRSGRHTGRGVRQRPAGAGLGDRAHREADRRAVRIALRELVDAEVASVAADRSAIEGPPVFLSARMAQVLALALHELATNAVKYGASVRRTAGWTSRGRSIAMPARPCSGSAGARATCRRPRRERKASARSS